MDARYGPVSLAHLSINQNNVGIQNLPLLLLLYLPRNGSKINSNQKQILFLEQGCSWAWMLYDRYKWQLFLSLWKVIQQYLCNEIVEQESECIVLGVWSYEE